jgi:hypothetical protein
MPKKSEDALIARIDRMWNEASNERQTYDWKWYIYDMYVKGHQDVRYDRKSRTIVGTQPKDGRPKVTINKIQPTLRNVRNYALRNRPKAEAVPDSLRDDSLMESYKATKFLDYVHDTQRLQFKLKGTLWNALKYSVGWWQVVFDEEIKVNEVDTFDAYPDPKARSNDELRYFILAVRRTIESLENDPKYDKKEVEQVKADNKSAASSYKQMLLSYDQPQSTGSSETETVIVKEVWYKEDGKIMLCTEAGGRMIRKPEVVDTKIIPFFKLQSDIIPCQMYGDGWVKNMIDPQKLINSAMASIAEYNVIMNKAKIIADKGAGVRIFNNEHGQIIEKNRGYNVSREMIAPINAAVYQQIDYANTFIEDIGAMHDASRGRVPSGAKSGRAIEALQLGDSNNMSELVDNIEMFLEDVYEYILWIASKNYMELKTIQPKSATGERQYVKVIGQSSPVAQQMEESGMIPENTLIIPEKNIVDVKISSWLSYTPEGKRESVKELFAIMPDLPPDVILDAFGVGNIAEVIQNIKRKQQEDREAALEQEKASAETAQEVQTPSSGPQEAIAAIRTLIEGGMPQAPARAGQEYLNAIDQFLQRESEMGELDDNTIQSIQTFRDQVAQGVGRA